MSTLNPYDEPNACVCNAWYEGECGCGGFVDYGKKLAWDEGYAAAMEQMRTVLSPADFEALAAALDTPPAPNEALRRAAREPRRFAQEDDE